MSQIDNLKGMLDGLKGQVKSLDSLKNLAQSKIDSVDSSKISETTGELNKAIKQAQKGNSEGLNNFIQSHANKH